MNGMTTMKSLVLALSLSLYLTGCCHCRTCDKEEMMSVGASLKELSAAIEGHVRYNRSLPTGITGEELLDIVDKDNSQLLEPFQDYLLKVQPQDRHAIVLVCTKGGKTGLLEDAGCTAQLDKHLWEANPKLPCEFTLKASEVCAK